MATRKIHTCILCRTVNEMRNAYKPRKRNRETAETLATEFRETLGMALHILHI